MFILRLEDKIKINSGKNINKGKNNIHLLIQTATYSSSHFHHCRLCIIIIIIIIVCTKHLFCRGKIPQ
jgi:hypothetical protein